MPSLDPLGVAIYRLQMRPHLDLAGATEWIPYLERLGVSALYLAPLLEARPESTHGYDAIDPTRLDPHLGTEEDLEQLSQRLQSGGLGLILDIVPNHLAADPRGPWFRDVLRWGERSERARVFDIDWSVNEGRLVVPVLGEPIARVLESGELTLGLDGTEPVVRYFDKSYPLTPSSWSIVLGDLFDDGDPKDWPARLKERLAGDASLEESITARLEGCESTVLEDVLSRQCFELAYWKDATLNYRRFFDIDELIGVRVEDETVFEWTHARIFEWLRQGWVQALRVDHVDGLRDPTDYLERLDQRAREAAGAPVPILVEKILVGEERLPESWPIAGTTGYELLTTVDRLLLWPEGVRSIERAFSEAHSGEADFEKLSVRCRRKVLESLFHAELKSLSQRVSDWATARGMTVEDDEIVRGLSGLTTHLPVYRTYLHAGLLSELDRSLIDSAMKASQGEEPVGEACQQLLRDLFLAPKLDAEATKIVLRWQQLTGPVMAKGVEDTALYGHHALVGRNEVGGHPDTGRGALQDFHELCLDRQLHWPRGLSATSTHDTKRSADVRARLAVLSELGEDWLEELREWMSGMERFRCSLDGEPAPSVGLEWLIHQTLLGTWPLRFEEGWVEAYDARLDEYWEKALREAKRRSSWTDPDAAYEAAVQGFVSGFLALPETSELRLRFERLASRVAFHGALNSLARTLLQIAAPGVPDLYQGTGLWNLSLVDPDNRREVDLEHRIEGLEAVLPPKAAPLEELRTSWIDGRIKLLVLHKALIARREHREVFAKGSYLPLTVCGSRASNVVAFARKLDDRWIVVATSRLTTQISEGWPLGEAVWSDTAVQLPEGAPREWRDALTGERRSGEDGGLRVGSLFEELPGALLAGEA
ncbi:MAG: malto-oligosyltrehalose synthase [Planctomycetota bacterium]